MTDRLTKPRWLSYPPAPPIDPRERTYAGPRPAGMGAGAWSAIGLSITAVVIGWALVAAVALEPRYRATNGLGATIVLSGACVDGPAVLSAGHSVGELTAETRCGIYSASSYGDPDAYLGCLTVPAKNFTIEPGIVQHDIDEQACDA